MNNLDWFSKWNMYSPNSIAVTDFESGKTYTYSQLNDLSCKLSKHISEYYNLKIGDRIAVLAENCVEFVILFGVAQKLGIILVPLNYRLASNELNYIIQDCEPSLIIVQNNFLEKAKNTQSFKNVKYKLNLDNLANLLQNFANNENCKFENSSNIEENSPIFILYTSGTTAFPKGALYTHKMLFWNSINTELRLNITSNDKSINCAPPFHTGGWNVLFTPFLHHGAHTIIMKNFNPEVILQILDKEEITIWWAVPTMLKMLSESESFSKSEMKRLRYLIVGGEALPLEVINTWHNKGVPIRQGYGLTEVGPNVTSLNQEDSTRKLGSIGTPNFYIEAKIVDENGNEITNNGAGEFLLKGPNVTTGYWNKKEETKLAINDGWFSTGDVVMRDSDGFLYVVDRIKNMYISGGENVYPAEIEHILRQHPQIDDVAIIGVSDNKWGEVGKAFIVKKQNSNLTEYEVADYCVKMLAKYKIPKHIIFLENLPTNDSGKIDRKQLKSYM